MEDAEEDIPVCFLEDTEETEEDVLRRFLDDFWQKKTRLFGRRSPSLIGIVLQIVKTGAAFIATLIFSD